MSYLSAVIIVALLKVAYLMCGCFASLMISFYYRNIGFYHLKWTLLLIFMVTFLLLVTQLVDISQSVLVGRPYGGTGILYRRKIAKAISVLNTDEPRLTAVRLMTKDGPALIVNVYMPTEYGTADCYDNYRDVCAKIGAMFNDTDAAYLLVMGDFNCDCNRSSRFFDIFSQFSLDHTLLCSDRNRLKNVFTYCKDDGSCTSWIDHLLCSKFLDDRVTHIGVRYDFQCSDHRPLSVTFSNLEIDLCAATHRPMPCLQNTARYDWSKVDIEKYQTCLSSALSNVNIPHCALGCSMYCTDVSHLSDIDKYYADVVSCIVTATNLCVPVHESRLNIHNVPGWSDFVKEKHDLARDVFLEWVAVGKPRSGPIHQLMCRTRAGFKMALRYCRASAEQIKADTRAAELLKQDSRAFWKGVARDTSRKVTGFVNKIGDATGETDICEMWKNHFSDLYNCISDNGSKSHFHAKCSSYDNLATLNISVTEVLDAIKLQKKGKSAGPNGLLMESFIYGGLKLFVHLSLLYTLFIRHCYLPSSFMQSTIRPLVKNKGGDLTDPNNYRAIALANMETKILESILMDKVHSYDDSDKYQYGFKKGHSTAMCTSAVKKVTD